jgi:hypothetical protein
MAAKKTDAKKTTGKKSTGKKSTAKKAGAKKGSAKKSGAKKASAAKSEAAEKKSPATKGSFKPADVHLGHIFALRPRVTTSFRPEDLRSAKHALVEEAYESAGAAARAVADKALELLQDGPAKTKKGTRASGRW